MFYVDCLFMSNRMPYILANLNTFAKWRYLICIFSFKKSNFVFIFQSYLDLLEIF